MLLSSRCSWGSESYPVGCGRRSGGIGASSRRLAALGGEVEHVVPHLLDHLAPPFERQQADLVRDLAPSGNHVAHDFIADGADAVGAHVSKLQVTDSPARLRL